MGVGTPDGGLGAPQAAPGAVASCPISDRSKSLNVTNKENEDKLNTIPQFEQNLLSPSHLRITIDTEDKKIEIEQVKVTLVYKGHGCPQYCDHLESTRNEQSFTCDFSNINNRNLAHCDSHPHVTEFDVKNVTVEDDQDDEATEKFPENKETDDENVKVFETTEAVNENKTVDRDRVEKHGGMDEKEEMQYEDAVDMKESGVDGTKEKPMTESENLTGKDDNENENLEEVSSLDGIILPTAEEKEMFKAPSLLLVFDYRSDEWRVKEFGEIIILHRPEKNYQLQFRRYQKDGYVTSLVMVLKESFKLHQMRYNHNQAWEWTFHYITGSTGTGAFQTLAAKFLTRDVAYEFYNKIKECVVMLKNGGGVFDANSEEGFLAPSQPMRLISRTSTPTFGPVLPICGTASPTGAVGTVLQAKSADYGDRSDGRFGAYWISPISSKSRRIARNASSSETGCNYEEYKLKRTRHSLTPPLFNVEKNSTEDSKVSLVYKCHVCSLCFDRPEILLNRHLNNCSPTTRLVKTKCTCGLLFDQNNFDYHCEVHRKYTALNVKKVVVRDEKNLDIRPMRKVFLKDEMDSDEATEEALKGSCDGKVAVERSVKNDESTTTVDKIECQRLMKKSEMEAKVHEKVATNVLAVRTKAHRVYVCQCRLCFDRADFFIKHQSKCSPDAAVIKTTCVCDLIFDKYNFAYHCEVHRQVAILNVKYMMVRDEGILDISEMVHEFVEDANIKVTDNMKIALEKNVDQCYLVKNPEPKHTAEQNDTEGKIEMYQNISTGAKNNDAESENKPNYVIALKAKKVAENSTTPHENYDTTEEIIGFQKNKTGESREISFSASKEVITLTESINGEKSEVPNISEVYDKIKKRYDINGEKEPDLDKSNTIPTTINSDKKTIYIAEETLVKDENHVEEKIMYENRTEEKTVHDQLITVVETIDHCVDTEENETINSSLNDQQINETVKNVIRNKDVKEVILENKTDENQEPFISATKDVTVETNNEEVCNLMVGETLDISTNEEKQKCCSDNDPIDSDKETGDTVEHILVKNDNHVEKDIRKENIMDEAPIDHQAESVADDIDHDAESKENEILKKIGNTVEKILAKDDNHFEKYNTKENENEEKPVDHQTATLADKIEDATETEENETLNSTQSTQYFKKIILESNGNYKNYNINEAQENKTSESQEAFNSAAKDVTVETNNDEMCNVMVGETLDISIIERKQKCCSDNDPIDYDKKTGDTVEHILVKDDKHVEKDIGKENIMDKPPIDHQAEPVADEIDHDAVSKKNGVLNSTRDDKNVNKSEGINEAHENETDESQEALISATKETTVTIETCNEEKFEIPRKSELNGEIINRNDQKHHNLLKSTTDKTNNDNISTIDEKYRKIRETSAVGSDKKRVDINDKNGKTEKQASNATNSNQRKSKKQGWRNANSTSNDSKRNNRGRK